MSFFKRLFGDLFAHQELEPDVPAPALVSEPIVSNDVFKQGYKKWLSLGILEGMRKNIHDNWEIKRNNSLSGINMELFHTNLSKGFYFRQEDPWDERDHAFLIQYWIDQLLSKNYVLKRAHREVLEEGGLLKTIEEFYLKPSLKYRREAPFEQLFGNILIQHRMVNGKSKLVKLMANTYSDSSYKRPYDFEDLIHFILVL